MDLTVLFRIGVVVASIVLSAALIIVPPAVSIAWILNPLDRAAKACMGPTKFQIIDFFCLFFELQVTCAAVVALFPPRGRLVACVGFGLVVLAVWYKGVQILSQAGIADPRRRAAFVWFVLPTTYVVTLGTLPLFGLTLYAWSDNRWVALLLPMAMAVLGINVYLSAWICRGAAAPARTTVPAQDDA